MRKFLGLYHSDFLGKKVEVSNFMGVSLAFLYTIRKPDPVSGNCLLECVWIAPEPKASRAVAEPNTSDEKEKV